MTPNREDYLKVIFQTNEKNRKLSNKELAERLSVSPASASEMIKKLIESKHVEKDPKLGLKLTDIGTSEAKSLVRKHRLWEVFLVNHLDYSWTEVHDDAEVLEHVTSDLLADRLSQFLGNPEYCPHGSKIYGNYTGGKDLSIPLHDLKVGDKGQFVKVRDTEELLNYLEGLDFNLGESFEVVRIDDYEGPYHIKVEDKIIIISNKASLDIFVNEK
ncbi:metal-dependent transcriptional regulator [Erysipelothrix inopinata]|uniref:Manganese transport regulator n=1 Tax=Erysipelothrix inopinata TaxID=225084 RepID=A0A7G9S0J1_9FIRM|nr:metal-dependent transcriptional regulator [Erysipelothrix inopinata]QNN61366.1 metal-dependent transcriptional regulator [Erysipelothrix inopinata]